MPKRNTVRTCPRCGSRNVQTEGHNRKGRQIVCCPECDYEFELHVNNRETRNRHKSIIDNDISSFN